MACDDRSGPRECASACVVSSLVAVCVLSVYHAALLFFPFGSSKLSCFLLAFPVPDGIRLFFLPLTCTTHDSDAAAAYSLPDGTELTLSPAERTVVPECLFNNTLVPVRR